MNHREAVERYLQAAGRHLPDKLQAELRAALMLALDERGLKEGKTGDEAEVAAVLAEFGRPEQVARELLAAGQQEAGLAFETENLK